MASSVRAIGAVRAAIAASGAFSRRALSSSRRLLSSRTPEVRPEEEKLIVRSPYSEVEIPETNLADFVFKDVDKFKNNVALVRTHCASEMLYLLRECTYYTSTIHT